MPEDCPEYTVYGFTPDTPLAFTVPPVEATPGQPLPDAGPFLRVCAGVEEPSTVMLRSARELVGVWRHVHDERPKDTTKVNEQLNLYMWFIDREAGGHIKAVVYQNDTPLSPSTYGQWVAWLVWKYLLYALRQDDPAHAELDAAELSWWIESFNELVGAAQAGRLQLPKEQGPEGDGTEFPPRRVWPEAGGVS
ncbi:hypothetical protein ACFZC5_32860 [Nocardia gamkensis]|uniref:hypothetical protein n=1 Tax=Nocardia gamkensis TaxID=352869 RepID=UPI0036EF9273